MDERSTRFDPTGHTVSSFINITGTRSSGAFLQPDNAYIDYGDTMEPGK